jgi:glycosyltransferase involved in cell wall biosynthesis
VPILWAGRFARQKNVDLLIEIAALAPDFQFDVYGEGEERYKQKLLDAERNSSNLSLKGGFSSFEALPTQRYGAFLYTSLWDGIPTVLINAGMLGIPIIASNVGGIAELVDENTGWLVTQHTDPGAYVQALDELRSNTDEAARRAQCMIERVRKIHSWDAYSATLSETPSFLD